MHTRRTPAQPCCSHRRPRADAAADGGWGPQLPPSLDPAWAATATQFATTGRLPEATGAGGTSDFISDIFLEALADPGGAIAGMLKARGGCVLNPDAMQQLLIASGEAPPPLRSHGAAPAMLPSPPGTFDAASHVDLSIDQSTPRPSSLLAQFEADEAAAFIAKMGAGSPLSRTLPLPAFVKKRPRALARHPLARRANPLGKWPTPCWNNVASATTRKTSVARADSNPTPPAAGQAAPALAAAA